MEMSSTLYDAALVGHVIGITIMAGTTFIDFITFRAFWKAFTKDGPKSLIMEDYLYKLQKFIGIGMLLILISGVMMMVKMHEVWGAQTWFRIKMGVLLLIIINGFVFRRILGSKLRKALAEHLPANTAIKRFYLLKKQFTAVQVIQMLLFVIIYVLSVLKFN